MIVNHFNNRKNVGWFIDPEYEVDVVLWEVSRYIKRHGKGIVMVYECLQTRKVVFDVNPMTSSKSRWLVSKHQLRSRLVESPQLYEVLARTGLYMQLKQWVGIGGPW